VKGNSFHIQYKENQQNPLNVNFQYHFFSIKKKSTEHILFVAHHTLGCFGNVLCQFKKTYHNLYYMSVSYTQKKLKLNERYFHKSFCKQTSTEHMLFVEQYPPYPGRSWRCSLPASPCWSDNPRTQTLASPLYAHQSEM